MNDLDTYHVHRIPTHTPKAHQRFRNELLESNRAGAAAVEFALAATVLFTFFFAALEFCRVANMRQAVELALYEGARAGIVAGATNEDVLAEVERVLSVTGIRHAAVTVTPATITDTTSEVSVRIQIALDQGLYAPVRYFGGKSLDRSLAMPREGKN